MTEGRNCGRIVALVNNKGGVGKTTSAVNLAATLVVNGNRTLLSGVSRKGPISCRSFLEKIIEKLTRVRKWDEKKMNPKSKK